MWSWLREKINPGPKCEHKFKIIDAVVTHYIQTAEHWGQQYIEKDTHSTEIISQCEKCGTISVTKVSGVPRKILIDLGYNPDTLEEDDEGQPD